MIAALHALPPPVDAAVLPWCGDFPWWRFDQFAAPILAELDAEAAAGLERALHRHAGWVAAARSGPLVVCHGDVHPGNVVATDTGPVLLDWDLSCIGPAAWDHAPLMTWSERWGGAPGIYDAFAAGYGRSMRGDELAESLAELRLVAATLLRVRAGHDDPAAAAEAQQRLRHWRGDPDAPPWNAQ
jgi:Ser/Thr protein kinase RdoA (MazF antagonist)